MTHDSKTHQLRWTLLLFAFGLAVISTGLIHPISMRSVGVYTMDPPFLDTVAILAAGEAHHAGLDAYKNNVLDPMNRPHVYGPWWLGVGSLGLVRADAGWLGILLLLAFLGVGATVLAPRTLRSAGLATLLLASPPALLAMERGNNDLIVFLLLAGAAWLVTRPSWLATIPAVGLIVTAAVLKLYPVAAIPALAARCGATRKAGWLLAGATGAIAAIVLSSWDVYYRVTQVAPEPITIFSYGWKLAVTLFLVVPQERLWLVIGATIVGGLSGWIFWRHRRDFWTMLPATGFTTSCYVAGALCWGLCYVSTISFPYRLVLFILPARYLLERESVGAATVAHRFQLVAMLLLLWTPWFKQHLLILRADERVYGGPAYVWMALGAEQGLAFVISAAFGLGLLGWATRRLAADSHEC